MVGSTVRTESMTQTIQQSISDRPRRCAVVSQRALPLAPPRRLLALTPQVLTPYGVAGETSKRNSGV